MQTRSWVQYAILRTELAIFRLPGACFHQHSLQSCSQERGPQQRRRAMNAAPDHVMDLIFGRWRSQILSAGTELAVFDQLDKRRAKTAEMLAAELGTDPSLLYRLLRGQSRMHSSAS